MKKYHHYNSGRNRAQYKWSSQNANVNGVLKACTTDTANPGRGKPFSQYQGNSTALSNGLTNRYNKQNGYLNNRTKFNSSSRSSKYVYISNSSDTEKTAKPPVSKLPVQHKNNELTQSKPTTKFTGSRNDVFRFTSVPKVTSNLTTKNNTTAVQRSCKKSTQLEATATIATSNIDHHKLNKKRSAVIPSRNQLKWTNKDNANADVQPVTTNSKPQLLNVPLLSKRPQAKQLPSRSRFTWRRSSSGGTPKYHSSFNFSNQIVNKRYKMQLKSSPVAHKRLMQRKSVRKIVYIGGVAYNATARRLSRRLSSGSSKRKVLAKGVVKKAGNKVWVAEHHTGESVEESYVHPGYEIRRKKGNWQWIPGNKSALVRQANAIKHKYAACKSQLSSHSGKHRTKFVKVVIKNDVFVMDPSKRSLRRLSRTTLGGDSKRKIVPHKTISSRTPAHQLASHAVRRSKALVWHAARRKNNVPKSEQYCMFFNRFGKCSRRDKCPYIHDPDKIAVCTRFLRGTCDKTDGSCPFSHQITKEKMPVCSYFLRGVCTRDVCPYLHVYVGENAEICQDFVKGFCPNGDKCDKKHLLDCPEFSVSGKCSKKDKCPLRHKKRVHRRRRSSSTQGESKEPKAFKRRRIVNQATTNNLKDSSDSNVNSHDILITPDQLEFIPLEQGPSTPPDFIAL